MYNHINPKNGDPAPLVAEDVFQIVIDVSTHYRMFFHASFSTIGGGVLFKTMAD
jgi:hypothetical protein